MTFKKYLKKISKKGSFELWDQQNHFILFLQGSLFCYHLVYFRNSILYSVFYNLDDIDKLIKRIHLLCLLYGHDDSNYYKRGVFYEI